MKTLEELLIDDIKTLLVKCKTHQPVRMKTIELLESLQKELGEINQLKLSAREIKATLDANATSITVEQKKEIEMLDNVLSLVEEKYGKEYASVRINLQALRNQLGDD